MKPCVICGDKGYSHHQKEPYCNRHYQQMHTYGCIRRTQQDRNEIVTYGEYSEILLYNNIGQEIARAIIDTVDIHLVKDYKWSAVKKGDGKLYVINNTPKTTLPAILLDKDDNYCFAYVNKNPLDCRRKNLVATNKTIIGQNRVKQKNNTSGHKGVCWCTKEKQWLAYIIMNRRQIRLGFFDNLQDAVAARKAAEAKYFTKLEDLTNV